MIPQTLADVARMTAAGESFDHCLANFLDAFYAAPAAAAIEDPPPLLAENPGDPGKVKDAYLAAVAEELAAAFSLPPPGWAAGESRHLKKPWFALPFAALRAVLLQESPPAFRCRNLFVSANALSRV